MEIPNPETVLCVDDDPLILSALRRMLAAHGWGGLAAESGRTALALMEKHSVDVLVCDVQMPHMSGTELLAEVRRRYPEMVCILLTGQPEVARTLAAVNDGLIQCFLKPWDNNELCLGILAGLRNQRLRKDRERINSIVRNELTSLRMLNESLAHHLNEQSHELHQIHTLTTEAIAELLNQRLGKKLQTNSAVEMLVKAYARISRFDPLYTRDLCAAASLYNLGKLAWSDGLLRRPASHLRAWELDQYKQYPLNGEHLLMTHPTLYEVARMIRHQRECWNGTGFPDRLQGETIPYGARLLRLIVDFVELQHGLLQEHQMNREQAIAYIKAGSSREYDPQIAKQFLEMSRKHVFD